MSSESSQDAEAAEANQPKAKGPKQKLSLKERVARVPNYVADCIANPDQHLYMDGVDVAGLFQIAESTLYRWVGNKLEASDKAKSRILTASVIRRLEELDAELLAALRKRGQKTIGKK